MTAIQRRRRQRLRQRTMTVINTSSSNQLLFVFAEYAPNRLCFILFFIVAQNRLWKIYGLSSFFFTPARILNVRFGKNSLHFHIEKYSH
jgi:uncharacterized membrane protein YecN with MAPEG domain